MTEIRTLTSDWQQLPEGMAVDKPTYALSDIHGRLDLASPLLKLVSRAEGPRRLISCGDVIDRGPEGIALCNALVDMERPGIELILLPGNHEIMMMDALRWLGWDRGPAPSPDNLHLWLDCGGDAVYRELSPAGDLLYAKMPALLEEKLGRYIEKITRSGSHACAGDLLFTHAGVMPGAVAETLALHPQAQVRQGRHWAWIRHDFLDWTGGWGGSCGIIASGHTIASGTAFNGSWSAFDKIESHRRIALDAGTCQHGQCLMLEAAENRYRFHMSIGEPLRLSGRR